MQYETINHKMRAAELRATAMELERRGYSLFAEMNREEAEWLDPTPRERPERAPRRTREVEAPRLGVNHHNHSSGNRRPPRGTSVISRGSNGRVIRQTGAN